MSEPPHSLAADAIFSRYQRVHQAEGGLSADKEDLIGWGQFIH